MRLIIKNAEAAYINHASQPNGLNVNVDGVKVENILDQVNITDAINYYGITELLDTIGDEEVRLYLNLEPVEKNETALKTSELTSKKLSENEDLS